MQLDSLDILNADSKKQEDTPKSEVKEEVANDVVEAPTVPDDDVKPTEPQIENMDLGAGLVLSGIIIDGKLNGICKLIKNGHCTAELSYVDGLKEGTCKFYTDERNGTATFYNASGVVQKTETYLNDLKHGPSITYYENSAIFEQSEYENDLLKSPPIRFDLDGKEMK